MSQRAFLYNLQKIDDKIGIIVDRIEIIDQTINNQDEINSARSRIDEILKAIQKEQIEFEKIETKSNSILTKMKLSEKDLFGGKISNSKELQSLEAELRSLKNMSSQLEDALFSHLATIDALELKHQAAIMELDALIKEKEKESIILKEEKNVLNGNLQTLQVEREPIQALIKSDLLEMYDKLRKTKNNLAVVVLQENSCSACGNSITPAEMQKAKSAVDEYYCQVCKRFLYYG